MKKRIAILGSTGSIGSQALEVIRDHPDRFEVEVLTARNSCDLLISQAMEFQPNVVVIGEKDCYPKVSEALASLPIKVFAGDDAITQVVEMDTIDLVLCALVGYAGLKPTLHAIRSGKQIALANKETLVVAGELVMEEAIRNRVFILPVDSEHSAIFQCLSGESPTSVEKVILTASGGPFRGMTPEQLASVTREEALKHPNWSMGKKITIDSATMMNKGLEVIEASRLFNLRPSRIEVVIHPQSVIHSMVQFTDGSIKAQMGLPDMRGPIIFALAFPERIQSLFPRFSFADYPALTFEPASPSSFRCLSLAYQALEKGGNNPCVLNAANEAAVCAFLGDRITFLMIPEVIGYCMDRIAFVEKPGFDSLVQTHQETLALAEEFIRVNHH